MISALGTLVELIAVVLVGALLVTRTRTKRRDRADRSHRDDT